MTAGSLPVLAELDTDVAELDTDVAERAADPARFVIDSCERAKAWLAQVLDGGSIEDIVELKSQAEAVRVYTMQKQLGKDAQLAAAEVVRRAERGIGLAIRRGQQEGTIARQGQCVNHPKHDRIANAVKPVFAFIERHEWHGQATGDNGVKDLTDGVTDEQFDAAIDEAKAEGNLSRANVARKVRGEQKPAADRGEFHRKRRHVDHYRVLNETCATLDGLISGLRLIDAAAIPADERAEWAQRLKTALRPINRYAREIAE